MRSNYKQLGQYISELNIKNTNLEVDLLLGVSITKKFIPSIANTIGTDMSKYKIVRKNQFAYGPITSRNGDKISVALLTEEQCIISTSYRVFEVKDHEELDPEYLMMWFRRPEFDRYARFMSHGSTREAFDWDEMCETELPVPSIEKQREIVKEYNTIVNRIKLNEQLNQKLEETAQAIYKHWFVDFDFPTKNGNPYKSSGGKLVYDVGLDKEVPEEWATGTLELLGEIVGGATPSKNNSEYWTTKDTEIRWISPKDLTKENYKFIDRGEHFITALGYKKASTKLMPANSVLFSSRAPIGILGITTRELCTNQGFKSIVPFETVGCHYVYYFLKYNTNDIADQGSGTTFSEVSGAIMKEYPAYLPSADLLNKFSRKIEKIFTHQKNIESSNKVLKRLKSTLLSKMSKVESPKTEQVL